MIMNWTRSFPGRWLRQLGPGLITAAVVLGPGSILSSSQVGATFGYSLVWLLLLAGVFMAAFTEMSARIGCVAPCSLLELVSQRYGRTLAAIIGISAWLVATGFQFGNNMGVLTAFEGLVPLPGWIWPPLFSAASIFFLFRAQRIYRAVERLTTVLVAIMLAAFLTNLVAGGIDARAAAAGLIPRPVPGGLGAAKAMVATTFSIVAAFYQSYLVQEKGWRIEQCRKGVQDAWLGIGLLAAMTLMILLSAAHAFGGQDIALTSAADVARQLERVFGGAASTIFCLGLAAASFSSFIINTLIGGGLLADGLGIGHRFDERPVKLAASASMLVGMAVALAALRSEPSRVGSIIVAQTMTLLVAPLSGIMLLVLANSRSLMGEYRNRALANLAAAAGLLALLWMTWTTGQSLFQKVARTAAHHVPAGTPAALRALTEAPPAEQMVPIAPPSRRHGPPPRIRAELRLERRGARVHEAGVVPWLAFNPGDVRVPATDTDAGPDRQGRPDSAPRTSPDTGESASDAPARIAVAILDDGGQDAAAADPQELHDMLADEGFAPHAIRAADLAGAEGLRPDRFPLLILPRAPTFPAILAEPLRAYLAAGGSFLALGGYAFDRPTPPQAPASAPPGAAAADAGASPAPPRINTRYGRPGDTLQLDPLQIGIFDPTDRFAGATLLAPAPDQFLCNTPIELPRAASGWSAVALTGSNHPVFPNAYARWIPLLEARDAQGDRLAPALALVFHFDGPYCGAAWAFCGVDSADPWAGRTHLLAPVARALLDRVFLIDLEPAQFTVDPRRGPLRLTARLANFGAAAQEVAVTGTVADRGGTRLATLEPRIVLIEPGTIAPVEWLADLRDVDVDFALLHAEGDFDGGRLAPVSSGVVLASHGAGAAPEHTLRAEGRQWLLDGRARLALGTNETGMIWHSPRENPLVWDRDLSLMRDHGLRLLRLLHFSPFGTGAYDGRPSNRPLDLRLPPPARLIDQTDALVRLAHRHGVILCLTLHDWMGVALTDAELAAQTAWNHYWVARYRDWPLVTFDVQNEPAVDLPAEPWVRALWDQTALGTGTAHAAAGGDSDAAATAAAPPPWKQTPAGAAAWNDHHTTRIGLLRRLLLDRWVAANAAGIESARPDALWTVGYLPTNDPADPVSGSQRAPFTNRHFYGATAEFAARWKWVDRRGEGRPLSLGEFGASAAHDARTHGRDDPRDEDAIAHYLHVAQCAAAWDAAWVANWDWKDMHDCEFPWGIMRRDLRPRPALLAYRAAALLYCDLAASPPAPPPTVVIVPQAHRAAAREDRIDRVIESAFAALLEIGYDFSIVAEGSPVPPDTRLAVWPVPYAASDAAVAAVATFARAGGTLLVTGDFRFRPGAGLELAPDRAGQLGLDPARLPAPAPPPDGADAASAAEQVISAACGQGTTLYCPAAPEWAGGEPLRRLYRLAGARAGIRECSASVPAGAHPLERHIPDGGAMLFVADGRTAAATAGPRETRWNGWSTDLAAPGQLFLRVDAHGRLVAAAAGGPLRRDGLLLVDAEPERRWVLRGLDADRPIEEAAALLFIPIDAGRFRIPLPESWPDAALQWGTIEAGRFRARRVAHDLPVSMPPARADIRVEPAHRLALGLICPRSRTAAASEGVAALLR